MYAPAGGAAVAEVISIGTELLLGQVLDTNSQFIATELAKLGIGSFFRSTVGDNKDRIKETFKLALNRADIIITTGGLGPTADDLTTECWAELFDLPLIFDQAEFERIKAIFASLKFKMPESNSKQAMRPEGSHILPNPVGTAPGIIWEIDEKICKRIGISGAKTILTFPGVPRELEAMWHQTAVPYLDQNYADGIIWSCELKHYGISESGMAEKFAHLLDLSNPTVAPYAGHGECRLRVTAKAKTIKEAQEIAAPTIEEIKRTSGQLCYGTDHDTLESVVGALLTKQNKTISTAESCTGGLISKRLTDISGSSAYTKLNLVTYANEAKMQMLGVSNETLSKHGAVSAECAREMAEGVRKISGCDFGLSITGIAGPDGGTAEKPVGLVYIGFASAKAYKEKELRLSDRFSRLEIRHRSASEALNLVRLHLLGN